jgi:aspartyl-tRNA synthetase
MENPDFYLPIEKIECYIGARVKISGIVSNVRDQGGLIFIDVGNDANLVQALVIPDNVYAYAMAKKILKGYIVEINGIIKECPASIQENTAPKKTEIAVEKIAVISTRSEEENKSKRILKRIKSLSSKNKKKII